MIGAGLLTGCGDSPSAALASGIAAAPTTAAPVGDIVISHFAYPVRAPVKPGQQVTIINDDDNHSLTADANGAFDVLVFGGGGVETVTAPMEPGIYAFHCKYHSDMHGSLTVQ